MRIEAGRIVLRRIHTKQSTSFIGKAGLPPRAMRTLPYWTLSLSDRKCCVNICAAKPGSYHGQSQAQSIRHSNLSATGRTTAVASIAALHVESCLPCQRPCPANLHGAQENHRQAMAIGFLPCGYAKEFWSSSNVFIIVPWVLTTCCLLPRASC